MMQDHLFEPILNIVYETMPRDNLLNSACLEFFEFIRRDNIKVLLNHLVENYREKIKDITYVDTFTSLILRYDQAQGYNANLDASFLDTEEDTPGKSLEPPSTQLTRTTGNRWQGVKDLDAAEEEYFNTSDDEDDIDHSKDPLTPTTVRSSASNNINGASPLTKSSPSPLLVDYPSDEEPDVDLDTDALMGPLPSSNANKENSDAPNPSTPTPPPERLAEKRRREEEDEDELGKLSAHKRRSSSSSAGSVGSVGGSNVLRRKGGRTFGKAEGEGVNVGAGAGGGPRKIAISLGGAGGKGKANEEEGGGGG